MLIGELAKLSGLSKDGIRHYEKMGILRSRPLQAGSRTYRDYPNTSLRRIEQVQQAQQLGLELKEIGPLLDIHEKEAATDAEIKIFLAERLAVVREKIAQLREIESFIESKLQKYESDEP